MRTLCKSMVLGAGFWLGVAIAANAIPLCCTPTGPCRPPGPQIATVLSANEASANMAPVPPYCDPDAGPHAQCIQRFKLPCHIPKWRQISASSPTVSRRGMIHPASLANLEACLGFRRTA